MSIFKYLTLSHLQKVLAALDVRFLGIENNIEKINEINTDVISRVEEIEDVSVPSPYNSIPRMDYGTGRAGSDNSYARGDHVHPHDTSKADISEVLTKDNLIEYIPYSDYNPATKKYVDDKAPVSGVVTINGNTANFTSLTPNNIMSYWFKKNPIYYYESLGEKEGNKRRYELISAIKDDNGLFYDFIFWGTKGSSDVYIITHINSSNVDSTSFSGTVYEYSNSSGSSTLVDLTDTSVLSPTNGQILTYNSTTSKWENKNIPSDVFVVNISGTDPNYTSDKTYEEIATAYNAGKRCICIMSSAIYNLSQIYTFSSVAFVRFSTFLMISVSSDTGEKKAVMRSVFINANGTIQVNTMTGINDSDVLSKYNTESYTPTSDYHPATKKYVDDATNGITSNLSLAISNNVIQLKEGNAVISSVTLPVYNGGVSS